MSRPNLVFITSDWHLGGTLDRTEAEQAIPGTQICRVTGKLTEFIDWLRSQITAEGPLIELVINGDMVDFLAPDQGYEPLPWLGEETAAVRRFNQIADAAKNSRGRGPFEALRDFLAAGGSLVLLLGNHDVELSLPAVRKSLSDRLEAEGRRYTFIHDGEAYTRGQLLVEHGNRYDAFNMVDHSRLRQERSHLSRGLACAPEERNESFFLPPYGSELVANVYNQLLPQIPFLNLLKPENEAVIPLVIALCPESRNAVDAGIRLYGVSRTLYVNRLRRPAQPKQPGLLGATPGEVYASLDMVLQDVLGKDAALFQEPAARDGQLSIGESLRERLTALSAKGRELAAMAGRGLTIAKIVREQGEQRRLQQLQAALKKVRDEMDFSLTSEKKQYQEAAQELVACGKFSTVVFGHTHLAKRIDLRGGVYLNSGTWADVLRLPPVNSAGERSDAAVKLFIEEMIAKKLKDYVARSLTFVRAEVTVDGRVKAHLHKFAETGAAGSTILT